MSDSAREESAAVRIVLADDHVLVRELFTQILLQDSKRYRVVAEVGSADAAIAACEKLRPDVLVLDINLPGKSGIEALPALKERAPQTRVLVCSGSVTERDLLRVLRIGVAGFIEKTHSRHDFLEAIERVSRGENYFCVRTSRLLAEVARGLHRNKPRDLPCQLTAREVEILCLIAAGSTSKDIARKFCLSVSTVEKHRSNLMAKVHARNAAELIHFGIKHRLLRLDSFAEPEPGA